MLKIYPVLVQLLRELAPQVSQIEKHDGDLGRQVRRALSSSVLNVAEGMYSRGRNRQARYHFAMGSLRETLAGFEVAEAFGYAPALSSEQRGRIDRVLGTLFKLVQ